MGLPKGRTNNPKGRPKGIIDVRMKFFDLNRRLEELGFDPINFLTKTAQDEGIDIRVRITSAKYLLDKTHPDLKAIDINSRDSTVSDLTFIRDNMKSLLEKHMSEY